MAMLCLKRSHDRAVWGWTLGLIYIVAVAAIWIAASYIVQSVVDAGVSPFLITYICNSLFVIYIPIVEIGRYFEDRIERSCFWWRKSNTVVHHQSGDAENVNLLAGGDNIIAQNATTSDLGEVADFHGIQQLDTISLVESAIHRSEDGSPDQSDALNLPGSSEGRTEPLEAKGRWTRKQVAAVSLLICPFWFLAQLTFNLSLKYTTVTSNTILSSTSSLFTFLVSVLVLGEVFTWVKLVSVLLCMAGTILVSLADSGSSANAIATNPLLGDILALVSAGLYAVYITLIRKKLPDENKGEGQASMAQFLGFLGLFNFLIFLPVALLLNFTKLESFHILTWEQLGLIVGKGLLDNVLSDYLWAKAILLTTTTVATAGLSIQVPIAAVVDTFTGHPPHFMDYLGAAAVMVGFAGINIPQDAFSTSLAVESEQEAETQSALDGQSTSLS